LHRRMLTMVAAIAILAGGTAAGWPAPVAGQTSGQSQTGQVKTDWSQQKLEAFAAASVALGDVQANWETRIADAETQQQREELRRDANQAMAQTIEDAGLTPEQYQRIYRAARQDETLHSQIMQLIEDKRSG